MKPLLHVVAILKNEASNIRGVLEAVKPWIDGWTVLDTGSTDNTQDIVREVMGSMPGELYEESFIDFATTRNRVLEIDAREGGAEFQIMLSGDEFLRDGEALRAYLETQRDSGIDLHRIKMFFEDSTFYTPRIFRTGSAWKYEGKVHEVPYNRENPEAAQGVVTGAFVDHVISDHQRRYESIWESHIPLLRAQLEENQDDERTLIFLAKSYEALIPYMHPGEAITYAMEAMSLYLRRLMIPTGSQAERNVMKLGYLDNARRAGVYSKEEALARALELKAEDPHRPEVHLLCLDAAMKLLPAPQVYIMAVEAAAVATEAMNIYNETPVTTTCAWRAYFIAASACRKIAQVNPEATISDVDVVSLMKRNAESGIAAGGPEHLFESFLQPFVVTKPEAADTAPIAVEAAPN